MEEFIDEVLAGDPQSIFLLVSWYFLLTASWSFLYCLRIRSWPSVTGVLKGKSLFSGYPDNVVSDQNYVAKVDYSYEVNGERYDGNRLSPFQMMVSHNARALLKLQMRGIEHCGPDQVRVFYNPRRPGKSFLIKPSPFGLLVVAVFGLTPFCLYFLA